MNITFFQSPQRKFSIVARLAVVMPIMVLLACAGTPAEAERAKPRLSEAAPQTRGASYMVRGKRYHLLATAEGYNHEGLATWYGGKFQGRKTANGERFDTRRLTAAHKTLPFNTRVEVTNLDTGRKVVVRINDRGPFSDRHIIDLSRAAADAIGMGHGARVRVRTVQRP